jgi:hypothetical protein
MDNFAALTHRLRNMPAEEKERMRRAITGEADDDLVRRGDVLSAIRSLMTNPVPPINTQVGITMALRQVARVQQVCP